MSGARFTRGQPVIWHHHPAHLPEVKVTVMSVISGTATETNALFTQGRRTLHAASKVHSGHQRREARGTDMYQ